MKKIKVFLLLLFLVNASVFSQINIVGRVISENDEPLEGVTVRIKGTTKGVRTNLDGKFGVNVKSVSGTILTFSYVGYETLDMKPQKGKRMVVVLKQDSRVLDEVVAVGYQDMKRKDITGSIAKVDIKDMLKAPVPSFDQALAGRVAGVNVSSSEGTPGGQMNIVIRGNNSVTQANSPLYVIDGFPIEDPKAGASINPNDIESINILKDASATAIYGARGANGVVIITTKKGKVGKMAIKYDGNFGVQRITRKIPLMGAYEFVKLQSEVWDPAEMKGDFGYFRKYEGKTYTLDDYKDVPDYNWQDMIFRDAFQQNHSVNVTGGTAGNRYNASFSHYNQDGIVLASNYKRTQARIANMLKKGKLSMRLNINYSNSTQTGNSPSQSSSSGMNNLFYSVWGYRPVTQPGVPLSTLLDNAIDESIDTSVDYRFNPILSLNNDYRKNNISYTQFNGYLQYEFLKGLRFKSSLGYTIDSRNYEAFNNSKSRYGSPISIDKVNAIMRTSQKHTWLNENILTFQRLYNRRHSVNMLGGVTLQNSSYKFYSMKSTQIPNESLGMAGMDAGKPNKIESLWSDWSMMSFLARINYNYRSKYYLTASFRADGSSKFKDKNRFSYFPSTALAWTFTKEKFMRKHRNWLSNGKLRAGWGVTGNNRVGDYARFARVGVVQEGYPNGVYSFDDVIISGVIPTSIANNDLQWETTAQWNVGLDLMFLKDRINLTLDYYDKTTYDLLINATLPLSSGFTSATKNVGKVGNRGIEVALNTVNIKKKNFTWTTNFNIAFNQNRVLGLNDGQRSLEVTEAVDRNFAGQNYIAKIGYPIGMMYGYIYEGTYKLDDFDVVSGNYILKDGIPHYTSENNTQPGFPKYKDLNGDGVIDNKDKTIIGRGTPIHTGGITNNFTYGNFDLSVFFQWSYGANIINANRLMFETSFARRRNLNQFASYSDRWTFDNPTSDIPRVNNSSSNLLYSTRIIEDGSYIRLKTLSFGYNIPKKLLKPIKVSSLRVYMSAQNLFTLDNYSGYDPEVSIRNKALTPNLDFSAYPRAASLNFGVNLKL